jgi:outer membrane immunogenic protein
VSASAIAAFCHGALAADLPTHKSPPPPPVAAAPNWNGFYLGIEGGGVFSNNNWNTTGSGLGAGFLDTTNRTTFSPDGGRLGGYAGFNYMISPTILTGLEGDIAAGFGGSQTQTGIPGTLSFFTITAPTNDTVTAHNPSYDGSVRGRLGTLLTPNALLYATGGVAFADPKYSIYCPGPAAPSASFCSAAEAGSVSPTQVGWTIGAGVELLITNNWLVRAEYRFSDFGSRNSTFFANGGVPAGIDSFTVRTRFSESIANFGISYKF